MDTSAKAGPHAAEEARAFLEGDPRVLAHVRELVRQVVGSFHAPEGETAGDLVQEAMSRLCASLRAGRFRGEASLETYAQSIARHTCLNALRTPRYEAQLDVETLPSWADWSRPEQWLIRREEFQSHLRALTGLAPDSRELLRLVFVERRSYRDVAALLGISEGALKSRIHRCRLALRTSTGTGAAHELARS